MPHRIIGENNVEPSFMIDDYVFDVQNGVSQITIQHRDHYGWDIEFNEIEESEVEVYYYYIDGIYNDAFGHWAYESSVYLTIFDKLKDLYPSIKILSFKNKKYKNCYYEAFNIKPSHIVNQIESSKNKVIFIKCSSMADHTNCYLYLTHVRKWYSYLTNSHTIEKDIDVLYLPRGTLDNYREITDLYRIQSELLHIINQYSSSMIYFADISTKNMKDQINLIKRAKIVILNEGSNHGINGFFAENSHIIVLGGNGGGNGYHFQNTRPALVYYDSVKRGNLYYHIEYNEPVQNVIQLIDKLLKDVHVSSFIPPPVTCWREDWKGCNECNHMKWRYPESLE